MTTPNPSNVIDDTDGWSNDGPTGGPRWLDVTLAELPAEPALVVPPDMMVGEVVALMNEQDRGAVLVMEQERLLGIFTERDAVRRAMLRPDGLRMAVSEFMTRQPRVLTESTSFATALGKLTSGSYHHLPVINAVGCPAKLVSLHSIVSYIVASFAEEILHEGLEHESARARASGQWPAPPSQNDDDDFA